MSVQDTTEPAPAEAMPPPGRPTTRSLALRATKDVVTVSILVGTFVSLAWHASRPMTNNDTYFHLRFGREFLDGTWSLRDPGSPTTFGTNDWVPTQWLPQVVMAQVESWFGLAGVAWFQGLLHLGLALVLWLLARRYAGPLTSAVIVAVALTAASPGLSMRPQVISYVLVALTTAAWMRTREDGRARWWLIPMTWLWAMCHGMWPVGVVIGIVALIGIAADRAADRRTLLRLAAVPIGSAVAAALTPVGPALYPAVLLVGGRGKYFAEWQPANFVRLAGISLVVLAAAVLLRMLLRRTANTWTDALLVGLACAWALYTNRTVAVGAMMLVPVGARVLGGLRGEPTRPRRAEVVAVVGGTVACLAVLALAVPRTADQGPEDPSWAQTLDDLPDGTPIVNDWGRGGWFMWRWPELDFMMNGYGDIYTDAELDRNFRVNGTSTGWVSDVERTGAHYALVVPGSSLDYELEQHGWSARHRSPDLVFLVAPSTWPDRSGG